MTSSPAPFTTSEIVTFLASAMDAIRGEYSRLPSRVLTFQPGPDEWSILEVLGHLIEAEQRGFAGRIRLIVAQDGRALDRWDPGQVARDRRDRDRDPSLLLGEFVRLREVSLQLVERLRDADLVKRGEHPAVGTLTVNDILHEWVHHDRNHIAQMMANVQTCAWPHMGNAQKFSTP
ncbi:MAG TPA: DinB family protein [Candidatus Methylomirabilis sp.]|nr:DinB family protein [Candidatus Methylomirabilis sp.]